MGPTQFKQEVTLEVGLALGESGPCGLEQGGGLQAGSPLKRCWVIPVRP